jgi:hypothetical protein
LGPAIPGQPTALGKPSLPAMKVGWLSSQRVSVKGVPLWTKDGVPIAHGSCYADTPKIATDGEGGGIIAWQDDRAGARYAQRLDEH